MYRYSALLTHNGTQYYIDACNTFDAGPELMVFALKEPTDMEDTIRKEDASYLFSGTDVKVDWTDLYAYRAGTQKEIEEQFDKVVADLGKYIGGDFDV